MRGICEARSGMANHRWPVTEDSTFNVPEFAWIVSSNPAIQQYSLSFYSSLEVKIYVVLLLIRADSVIAKNGDSEAVPHPPVGGGGLGDSSKSF